MPKEALILVDIQNDFLPGGALAVPKGDEIIPAANRLMASFELVVATRDWHPADHKSFAVNHPGHQVGDIIQLDGLEQILWPAHCVQGSRGAEFALQLDISSIHSIFFKGTDPQVDSYSCFFDNAHRRETGLRAYLEERKICSVYLAGLATDYCVKYSALDALTLGFKTFVIVDACRGVDLRPGDSEKALEDLRKAGAILETTEKVLQRQQAPSEHSFTLKGTSATHEKDSIRRR